MKLAPALRLLLFAFALLGASAPKAPFKEPDGFAGLKWGSSPEQAEKLFEVLPDSRKQNGPESELKARIKAGDVTLESTLRFVDGKFVALSLLIAEKDKSVIESAFEERYGAPTGRLGPVKVWTGTRVHIKLDASLVEMDHGQYITAAIEHADYRAYHERLRREAAGRVAKDL